MTNFQLLAQAALPVNNEDWGSERQIDAENAFFAAVEEVLPRKQFGELEDYCLKATTEEMVAEAMRLLSHTQGALS